ncbi:unnamed protein product [Owenia fusiformis]|uniref:non-specific serine/threonine protein kinase n=1 Tax=Owenia fusiformis TaxID=6347 RepID=A0A8J1YAB1_OWEFU|nr:unnamed protein product [Owenia fusiformis]
MENLGEYEYSKKDLIGHGAFAVVFKGRYKEKPSQSVAIKSITKKNLAKSQNLLSKEIKILKELSSLHHDNVVALLDCKETTNHVYLVMEYCNGGDLADYLQVKGTLSEDTISLFLKQIAGAMKALTSKGIVHRDLKPQNILLTHSGKHNPPPNKMKLKIADFGFARFLQDGVMAATLCGSPMYMAPEVIMSIAYDAKADLWSIGTIVFQCLTGKAPFQAQTPQQLKHFYEKNSNLSPNIPSSTSPELKDLLLKLLKRNARDRLDFDEFFKHPFLNKSPVSSKTSSPVPVPLRSRNASNSSDSPSVKTLTGSPLSENLQPSHSSPSLRKAVLGLREGSQSPKETSGFLHVKRNNSIPSSPKDTEEDYVLVPENLPTNISPEGRRKSPISFAAIFSDNHSGYIPPQKTVRVNSGDVSSPTRPSSLPVQSPKGSPGSQPIPVPSHRVQVSRSPKASRSPVFGKSPSTPAMKVGNMSPKSPNQCLPRQSSESRLSTGSTASGVGSMTPPSVSFTVGTPPSGSWKRQSTPPSMRRQSSTTPPSESPLRSNGSPHRSNGSPHRTRHEMSSPKPLMVTCSNAGNPLPTIAGSPNKLVHRLSFPDVSGVSPTQPLQVPFGGARNVTCPDVGGMANFGEGVRGNGNHGNGNHGNGHHGNGNRNVMLRANTEPVSLTQHPALRAQAGALPAQLTYSPPATFMVPYSTPPTDTRERRPSVAGRVRTESMGSHHSNETPPTSLTYAQSPPNMEGPVAFSAPELAEEILMDPEHNETMSKLNFIVALVDCIIELAQSRSTPLTQSVQSKPGETVSWSSEGERRVEQLVLYVRVLQLLSSSLQLAKQQIKARRLQTSTSLKTVVKEMSEKYHTCLKMCKSLHNKGVTQVDGMDPESLAVTADKLIYNYAIEMCQSAALDEIFGNPSECFHRYQCAQILLHSLAQQARNDNDKELLNKYKEAVEKRLYSLQGQGLYYCES